MNTVSMNLHINLKNRVQLWKRQYAVRGPLLKFRSEVGENDFVKIYD